MRAGLNDETSKRIGLMLRDFGITFEKKVEIESKDVIVKTIEELFEIESMASIAEKTGINIHTIKRIKNFNSNFSEKTLQAFLKAYPMLDFNSFSSRIYRRGVTHKVKVADIFDFIIEERVFNEEKNSLSS